MRQAMLYDRLPDSGTRCNVCQWRCLVGTGKLGVCRVRQNRDGTLYTLNYAEVSSAAVDPIEKKPLFHFYPGTMVFSLGGWGCNFHCRHCQNWQISCIDGFSLEQGSSTISPQDAVAMARERGCQGIAWTYNEPTMWFEYTLDSARLAKESGLYTVYVTNGYITEEALDAIGPYLDAYRVDVKGFSDSLYHELARVSKWRGILDVAERAFHRWGMHVEVVTNVIPTMNDDDEQLEGIATWIRDGLSELVPWHVTRFHPMHDMLHLPPTPVSTLEHACDIGKRVGLRFVYLGNVPGHTSENTTCYSCGNLAIGRMGYRADIVGVEDSRCRHCGANLYLRTAPGRPAL